MRWYSTQPQRAWTLVRDVGETSCASQVQILNEDFVDAFHSEHSNIHMNGNVIPFKGNLIVKVIIFFILSKDARPHNIVKIQHCVCSLWVALRRVCRHRNCCLFFDIVELLLLNETIYSLSLSLTLMSSGPLLSLYSPEYPRYPSSSAHHFISPTQSQWDNREMKVTAPFTPSWLFVDPPPQTDQGGIFYPNHQIQRTQILLPRLLRE